jgi:hypothetical protein
VGSREAVAEFDAARAEFEKAFATIPDEALGYLKPGDEYALGGLLVHVNWVLVHYERVLDALLEGGFEGFRALDPEDEVAGTAELTRHGIGAQERTRELSRLDTLHGRLRARFAGVGDGDWERKADVLYGAEATNPYPTSPSDIAGWLIDHYREHVPQIAELVADWQPVS